MKNEQPKSKNHWFPTLLLKWNNQQNNRQMPWKGEKDPYKIWLSEIILQQTRVEQGLKYYQHFIKIFPDVHKLAKAPDEKIFKLWEGLGYYSRCRNLIATARFISNELKGEFPVSYKKINELKGVGPYTAAAIASFAYNLPYAVVDGNVFRVLARVFGIDKPIDSAAGKKYFSARAAEMLDKKQPGLYNQAIMDFGATVCKPATPDCTNCTFRKHCFAFTSNMISALPVKGKKATVSKRWFYYFVMEYKNEVVIKQRTEKDIWKDLYDFPVIEAKREMSKKKILNHPALQGWLCDNDYEIKNITSLYRQQLSHQLITGRFITIAVKQKVKLQHGWQLVKNERVKDFAFPQFVNQYLKHVQR